jgi:alkylation response protein AidB-like acyl-CoA dehydrogenase
MTNETVTDERESIESFRHRARQWLAANLKRADTPLPLHFDPPYQRELQARLFDAGFAGIAFPRQYGGAGLTLEHQRVFAEESAGYETPTAFDVSQGMLAPTLLEHGSEALKLAHLPAMLRGETQWIQLLSEPSGGSDMAGVLTRATRDGDRWIINGAKMWSTGADSADYGMCLARTNFDVPKHRGLSMIAVPLQHPGVTIEPIIGIERGPAEFCQEFFDDVEVPLHNLIGDENQGWAVAQSLLLYERDATAGIGYGYGLGGGAESSRDYGGSFQDILRVARANGAVTDPVARQLIAESYVDIVVAEQTSDRLAAAQRAGLLKGPWGSLLKLGMGIDAPRRAEIALTVAAADGVVWSTDQDHGRAISDNWLNGRIIAIAGGTNEMQRNIVSERILALPREPSTDTDVPFGDVLRRRPKRS